MNYRVVFSPEAQEQLADIFRYIAEAASLEIGIRYTDAIVGYCESLRTFPLRGNNRDDVRLGLRVSQEQAFVTGMAEGWIGYQVTVVHELCVHLDS